MADNEVEEGYTVEIATLKNLHFDTNVTVLTVWTKFVLMADTKVSEGQMQILSQC